jgi:hypothetical protein
MPPYVYVIRDTADDDPTTLELIDGPTYTEYGSPSPSSPGVEKGRFRHLAKLITKTAATLFSGTSAATLTLTGTWPTGGARLSIVTSSVTGHTDCAGRVTVNGTENIDFLAAGKKTTTAALTSLPTITTANLDCNLVITVISSGGTPVYTEAETDLYCKIEIKSKSVPSPNGGWTSIQATTMQARGAFAVNDRIKFDINNPFDPTDGTEHIVLSQKPKAAYLGKENIKILEF